MKNKKPTYHELTPLTIAKAVKMCDGKAGSGKSEWTRVKLDFEFKTGNWLTTFFLQKLAIILDHYANYISNNKAFFMADFKINKNEVRTHIENNPDRRW